MSHSEDQRVFHQGMTALSDRRYEEAAACFEAAIRIESQRGAASRQMRYLSYYGLSTALADRPTPEAIKACEIAAKRDFCSAELQLNLGRVYRLAGKTTRALAAFERGLKLAPSSEALRQELCGADRRRRPAIPWLTRNHPLNRFLGKMRASMPLRAAR